MVIRHFPAAPVAKLVEPQDNDPPAVEGAVMVKVADELVPLKIAVTTAAPVADDDDVALKLTPVLPWRTVTVAGTMTAELLLDKVTVRSAAAFDTVTMQAFVDPAATLEERQVTDEITGADHNFRVALCEELPNVAFTEAAPSVATVPIATAKVAAALPLATVTLAGTVICVDVELRLTTVLAAAG
jgi:hypothetical protein